MANKKEETTKTESKDARQEKWEQFLEKYKKENPVKFAIKEARGEFSQIPNSFRG